MRIIAGQRRGHKFDGPKGRTTRPTSDLVREAIFNILRDAVEGREVLDLFAGTGALGLEALSRGAARALFVERDRDHAALIRRNLATLRFEDRGTVLLTDAYRWARAYEPPEEEPVIVFLDPPYREYEKHADRLRELLSSLIAKLPRGSILVAESDRAFGTPALPEPERWDIRRYGGTQVALRTIE
ncbi:MAG: 16S rRNA (guanine(966)-N(2))-methyltransferase RsmD [Isosphaeraceae bacterium]|nr:16S rRNA (guanine(966)-N(2))-methyltransferase RsmD [Isosphaeraceae bacterium]